MLTRQSNAGRMFGHTMSEFSRPVWSGRDLGRSSSDDSNLRNSKEHKMSITEVRGDLFASSDSLVHCVSRDMNMGRGIAAEFKKQFGGVDELRRQNVGIGEVAVLWRGGRYIYYLVTKERYFHKPTLGNLRHSLQCTRAHCQEHGVTKLAMPRIGCGLDKLNWSDVSQLLDEIFVNSDIDVTVFTL